jgi:hypothetical protein
MVPNGHIQTRVSSRILKKIVAEQRRIAKLSGDKPSIAKVVRILIERGLHA